MDVKLGICNFCVPGTGVFAPKFVKECGLDGMSIDFGTFEQGFPLGQVRMQEAYLEAKGIYEIEYPNIGCSGYDDIPFGGGNRASFRGSGGYSVERRRGCG